MFENNNDLINKKITSEVCIHHLYFDEKDYKSKGNLIKWNPSVKKSSDRKALFRALLNDKIDVIATDHAPHTLEEKNKNYLDAPSGGPLVQHALNVMLDFLSQRRNLFRKDCRKCVIILQFVSVLKKRVYKRRVLCRPSSIRFEQILASK